MHGWLPNLRRTARRKGDLMFRRFSPQAREVDHLGPAGSPVRCTTTDIGTEHILSSGCSGTAMAWRAGPCTRLGIGPDTAREQVLDIISAKGSMSRPGQGPVHPADQEGPGARSPGSRPSRSPLTWAPSTSCWG